MSYNGGDKIDTRKMYKKPSGNSKKTSNVKADLNTFKSNGTGYKGTKNGGNRGQHGAKQHDGDRRPFSAKAYELDRVDRSIEKKDEIIGGIAVVGAGAAGMMSAIAAAQCGATVTVYEPLNIIGKKIRITGKGRCNVTNDCTPDEFIKHVTRNNKFLFGAINKFSPADTMEFFEEEGVELKTERGRRVFPVSDKAGDIANALEHKMKSLGCTVRHERVLSVITENGSANGVETPYGKRFHSAVIVCTGGLSYPLCGATGDGLKFARANGISVTDVKPSLIPIITKENFATMSGLSLKNVTLSVWDKETDKKVYEEMGEMLFTHFGISGPLVLSASSHMTAKDITAYEMYLDLKPALTYEELDRRILSDFSKNMQKDFVNSLGNLLPVKMIDRVVEVSGVPSRIKVNSVTKEMRSDLVSTLKKFKITPVGTRPIEEAIVTCGGVEVGELSPRTMETKKVKGLFFAGEVCDLDAYTGGYNLQIAFATGHLAGQNAAELYGFKD